MRAGSEWNIWDLHIHTPASFHWQGGKLFSQMTPEEEEKECLKIIEKIDVSEPIAFCIVDYFTFDGVLKIKKILNEQPTEEEKLTEKVIFPGIELRIEAPTPFRPNIQVIFYEDTTDRQLRDFKSKLRIFPDEEDIPLSREAIIESARNLPKDKAEKYGARDYKNDDDVAYKLGCQTIKITKDSFKKATRNLGENKCLIILPYDTSGGIKNLDWEEHPHDDLDFFRMAHFFEARNPRNIDLILGKKTQENKRFFANFQQTMGGKPKPVLSGSDAHKIENYGIFPHEKKTWLKANPTFKGLKQVVAEPASRCFIGEKPEKLNTINHNPTKFISKLEIKKESNSNFSEHWFDKTNIDFGSELIAIIGNKGSGKSALADIIGLLGNSKEYESFPFLNKDRFVGRGGGKAEHFYATLHWHDDNKIEKRLDDQYDETDIEKVKYIPQSYLEKLCNEISTKKGDFEAELKNVIFSHIPESEKLGEDNLDSLIQLKTGGIKKEINALREKLTRITDGILHNRKKVTDEYKQSVQARLKEKKRELEAIKKSKPVEVAKPTDDPSHNQEELKTLEALTTEKAQIEQNIALCKDKVNKLSKIKATLDQVTQKIKFLEQNIKEQTEEINQLLNSIGEADILSVPYQKIISKYEKLAENTVKDLNNNAQELDTLENKKKQIQKEIENLSEKIAEPQKKYRQYLSDIETWKKQVKDIEGDEHTRDTLKYIESQENEIAAIPEEILRLEEQRDSIVQSIHQKLKEAVEIYKDIHIPIQEVIKNISYQHEKFTISFDAGIQNQNFGENFFGLIDRGKVGTFYGIENSQRQIEKLLSRYDFSDSSDVRKFTRKIFRLLEHDYRDDNQQQKVGFESQVKDNHSPEELYNMIFGLKYLQPNYFLQLDEKNIEKLSPGERGMLLLIFYLIVDKDDKPLILDQPEENIDNETIYDVLVSFIKEAKEKRQIFLVTHNANLAVVCDAEQVIVASINRKNGNAISYDSGAIENPEINEHLINKLEGTKPAFENRESKYHELKE